jgi:hypothetical protein
MVPNRVAIRERVFRRCPSSFLSYIAAASVPHLSYFPSPVGNSSVLAMTLSERDQRILREIEHSLASTEPRLDRALNTGRLAALRWPSAVELHHAADRKRQIWAAGAVASLLAGIALLAAGLMLNSLVLTWVGIPLAQFGPTAIAYMSRKRQKKWRAQHGNVRPAHGLPGESHTGKGRDRRLRDGRRFPFRL